MAANRKEDQENLRVLYQALLEDIKLYKNQQWLITYYVVGIYIAITSIFFQLKDDLCCTDRVVFAIITSFVMVAGIVLLSRVYKDLQNARKNKFEVINKVKTFEEILKPSAPALSVTIIMLGLAIVVGGGLVFYLILFH